VKYMSKPFNPYRNKCKVFSCSKGALGEVDKGALVPVFTASDDTPVCVYEGNSEEVFRSVYRGDAERFRAELQGSGLSVYECKVKADRLSELEKKFPGALLPGRYVSKKEKAVRRSLNKENLD